MNSIWCDISSNPANPKAWVVLSWFRLAHRASHLRGVRRPIGLAIGVTYRVVVEWVLGVEIPWKTQVGVGVRLFHGQGLVINDGAIIGQRVTLRNGVVIGNVEPGGPSPVVEDDVIFGANSIALGGIIIGSGATVGAGAVVTHSVPPGCTVVGVPAKIIRHN